MKKKNVKIAIIGAGNVGSTLAMRIAERCLADVVMVDVRGEFAQAKSLDLSDAAYILGHESNIFGTDNFEAIRDSSVVIVTAGFPRTPGMSREELLAKNKKIIEKVSFNIKKYALNSIIIIVTNPLDVMTYVALKASGFSKNKVFGMAGDLDTSRLVDLIAQKLKTKRASISTIVMGSHGDTMVPVISHTKVAGKPIGELLSREEIDNIIKVTKNRGAQIVSLLEQGSAYYAPSAAVLDTVETIIDDKKKAHCVSAFLEKEYGLVDICIGVPAKIGKNGIEEILEIELSDEEKNAFRRSANAIKRNLELIKEE